MPGSRIDPMAKFDAHNAECQVFTFKEGALSALAHDLEIGSVGSRSTSPPSSRSMRRSTPAP